MHKSEKKVFIKQWLYLKPYDKQVPTDLYFLKICNKVKQILLLQGYLDDNETDVLACFLTSYFEDLVSETNIWNTFVQTHKKMYGKPLPFFDVDEYYYGEINLQDIYFLIWYLIYDITEDNKFISPLNDLIIKTSEKIMVVFEDAWEYAPENKVLKSYYSIDEDEKDFYEARNLIDTIFFRTYLFFPDTLLELLKNEREIVEEKRNEKNLLAFLNEYRDQRIHSAHTRLLGLKGKEWAAAILGEEHRLSEDFLNISQKISGLFTYKGQDKENVFIEHIASGKKFDLTKKSLDHAKKLKKVDTILFMGIVRWRNEWWFSGIYFERAFDAKLVLDEKNSIKSRSAVNFLDHRQNDIEDTLAQHLAAFRKFNSGRQIAFMDSDSVEAFVKGYIACYNGSLNLSEKEIEESKERARKDGFFGDEKETLGFSEVTDSALVFFNPKSGVEIALNVNSAFPMKENPFFNEGDSKEDIMFLLSSNELSTELAMYCVDNFKADLPFFKSAEGQLYLDNLDFFLRFWKRAAYFTEPTITFTGNTAAA